MCRPDEPGKTPLNVIYLNALADDDRKQFFVAALAAEIYRWMVTSLDAVAGPAQPAVLPRRGPRLHPRRRGQAAGQGAADPAVHPGAKVRRRLPALHAEPAIGRLQRLRQLQHQAGRPPGEPAGRGARRASGSPPRARRRPGSRAARGPRPAASSADGRGMPAGLEGQAFRSRPLFSLHEGAWSPDRLERNGGTARRLRRKPPALQENMGQRRPPWTG